VRRIRGRHHDLVGLDLVAEGPQPGEFALQVELPGRGGELQGQFVTLRWAEGLSLALARTLPSGRVLSAIQRDSPAAAWANHRDEPVVVCPGRVNTSIPNRDSRVREREGETMPLYLSRFSYTPETWARLIGKPEDRRKAAQSYIESVGGKLHGFWYAFGKHDGYSLWEAPDNVSMAAVALAISAGGALSSLETTVLLTVDETIDALRKAEQVQYRAPGA